MQGQLGDGEWQKAHGGKRGSWAMLLLREDLALTHQLSVQKAFPGSPSKRCGSDFSKESSCTSYEPAPGLALGKVMHQKSNWVVLLQCSGYSSECDLVAPSTLAKTSP